MYFSAIKTSGKRTWSVHRSGASRAVVSGMTRFDAWKEARRLARGKKAEAFLFDPKTGRIVASNSYGPLTV